jgi:rfaE bifunctional protein nucleotidyltransferase chain/domain
MSAHAESPFNPACYQRVLDKIVTRHSLPPLPVGTQGKMVFTNGVFDIIHRGHVSYLAQARGLGDALVVGLNSDSSARSLGKGPDRPINAEADRALVIASLHCVDLVVLFDEPTPVALIQQLRPDVYVKGGDYDMDTLEETRLVRGWGGQSLALPFVSGYSTTQLVKRLRAPRLEAPST